MTGTTSKEAIDVVVELLRDSWNRSKTSNLRPVVGRANTTPNRPSASICRRATSSRVRDGAQ